MGAKRLNTLKRIATALALIALFTNLLPGTIVPVFAAAGDTTRVSVDSSGAQANGYSRNAAISNEGRFVAFMSSANNLVSDDTNSTDDIFVRDRQTGQTTRVSVNSSGKEANGYSDSPAISNDGRFVVFASFASNLVDGDTNGMVDVFVHDRQSGQTTRISVDSTGVEANGDSSEYNVDISGDGRFVVFSSDATNLVSGDTNSATDVFVHDRQTGQTTRVSVDSSGIQANDLSYNASISTDGRFVAFSSTASNLVSGDTNNARDIFVHDTQTSTTTRVSVSSGGVQADKSSSGPAISGDGRYVAFSSKASNLVPGYIYEEYIYVHDLQTGQTTRESVYTDGNHMIGVAEEPSISNDGRYLAFQFDNKGDGLGLYEVYFRDRHSGTTNLASVPMTSSYPFDIEDSSFYPAISGDGHIVAFQSVFAAMVLNDTNSTMDVFVHEVSASTPDLNPSVVSTGPQCGDSCTYPTPASIAFSVIFSKAVTGVTNEDFSLSADGVSGASVAGVSGSGAEYTVTVATGTGDGTLRLDVIDNDSILDASLNPLGGVGAGNGNFTAGSLYLINKGNPVVTSITLADANPTSAEFVHFTVTFSEQVLGVDASDFSLTLTDRITSAGVTEVTGSANTYTVMVNTGTGDGALRLDLVDNDSITDFADVPLGGPGAGNGDFNTGEIYTISKTMPSAPTVTSSLRADINPTLADLVSFTVTFSEPVNGVDPDDFSVITTGTISGAFVANASGSGNIYTVIAATGSGEGSLRLDVQDNDTIINASNIPLGGSGIGNGNFTTGEVYTVDKTAPYVTGSFRADTNPTTATSVNFTVTFSEAVSGVDGSDFFLSTGGNISGAAISAVSGSGNLYTVSVNTGSGDGMLRLDVLDDDSIKDATGNSLSGAGIGNGNFTTGEEYTLNRTPVNLISETYRSNGNNDGWVVESSEDSNQGGHKDSNDPTILLGDDAQNRQVRAILHFPTYHLPNNAVITRALLMIMGEGIVGSNPFDAHQNIVVDIRSGAFGFIGPFPYRGLQVSDFQAPAHMDAAGMIVNTPFNGWYWTWLDAASFQYINLNGITQIRLRFQIDDDDNLSNDYMRFYSGDYVDLALRPRLVIEYYTR